MVALTIPDISKTLTVLSCDLGIFHFDVFFPLPCAHALNNLFFYLSSLLPNKKSFLGELDIPDSHSTNPSQRAKQLVSGRSLEGAHLF